MGTVCKSKMDVLRDEMDAMFYEVKRDIRKGPQAKEMANLAGKINASIAVEIKYNKLRGERPSIDYINKQAE